MSQSFSQMSQQQQRGLSHFYSVSQQVLGKGAFGTVYLGTRLRDNVEVAVKVIYHKSLNKSLVSSIENEVQALQLLDHPNIIKFFDLFEDSKSFQICMELVRGGDLFDRVDKKTSYTEKDAQDVCRIILSALKHCHDLNVIHRDLKPENLMMRSFQDDSDIILVDFGLSVVSPTPTVTGIFGTTEYMAPEILSQVPYGKAVDMWSFGVIAYILLCGYQPFTANEKIMLVKRIRAAAFAFHDEYWTNMSAESKDFISQLLTKDVAKRMTVTQALNHNWVTFLRCCSRSVRVNVPR
jgi:calcium/calmodulin-dependent protein kinase I